MQETSVQSLGWEDPLEKVMAIHSCLENPMDRRFFSHRGGLQSMGSPRVGQDRATNTTATTNQRSYWDCIINRLLSNLHLLLTMTSSIDILLFALLIQQLFQWQQLGRPMIPPPTMGTLFVLLLTCFCLKTGTNNHKLLVLYKRQICHLKNFPEREQVFMLISLKFWNRFLKSWN